MPKSTSQIEKMTERTAKLALRAERSRARTLRAHVDNALRDDPDFIQLTSDETALRKSLHQTRIRIARQNTSIRAHERKIAKRLALRQAFEARERESRQQHDDLCLRINRKQELVAKRFANANAAKPTVAAISPARPLALASA